MKSDLFHAVDSVASLTTCSLLLHVAQTFEGLHAAILVLHCLVVPNRFHPSSEATTRRTGFVLSYISIRCCCHCNDSPCYPANLFVVQVLLLYFLVWYRRRFSFGGLLFHFIYTIWWLFCI